MKTAIIFNEGDIQYFVLDGDHRALHGAYINDSGTSDEVAQALSDLFYCDNGKDIHDPVSIEQFAEAIRDGAILIECGMLSMTTKFIWLFFCMCCISIGLVVGNMLSDSPSLFTAFDAGLLCGFVFGCGMMVLYPQLDQR